jgi:beta-glucanase (GH16 family)
VRDGVLRLVADRRRVEGRNTETGKPESFDYVSGVVTTFGRFAQRYGYFEMRARLPSGRGLWPAFWLLPDDKEWPPEIDIFEYPKPGGQVFVSNHFRDPSTNGQEADITGVDPWFDPTTGFHRYAVDWRPEEVVFYLDGRAVFRSRRGVPDRPMYVLANLAIGGRWAGPPDDATPFPATYEIDHVRVWRRLD